MTVRPKVEIDMEAIRRLPKSQREEAEALLAQLSEANRQNPLLGYYPHAKQVHFHNSRKRIKAFFGGNRSGKTTAGICDDLIQAVDRNCLPEHLQPFKKWTPPFKCRIVSPDFTSTMEGVIFEKIREWVPRNQLAGGSWEKAYDKQRRVLRFDNGSRFDFLTSEQDIDKFSGADLHRVHFDEEPPGEKGRQIYQECRMRLIDHDGDMVFSMTPLFGMSWVYDVVWERRGNEVTRGLYEADLSTVVTVDMDENPHLNEEAKELVLADMTEAERKARKAGQFVHFAGLVYEEFDPGVHVVNPIAPDFLKGNDIYVGIDPGLKTTAVVFCCFDADNSMLVFDEINFSGKGLDDTTTIPEEVVKRIREREKKWGRAAFYIIDPAARIGSLINAENIQSVYARAGLNAIAGQNKVEPGIFEVKRRLERAIKKNRPEKLHIARNCKQLLWEFSRYRMDPKAEEFKVMKENDHHLDALRYVAMARPVAPHTSPASPKRQTRWQYGMAPAPAYEDPPYQPLHPFGESY